MGSTQPLENEYQKSSWGVKSDRRIWLTHRHLLADCLEKMWEPQRLRTPWAFTACYRAALTFLLLPLSADINDTAY
jgi:hypothetical protein